jgi:hypothetical protein
MKVAKPMPRFFEAPLRAILTSESFAFLVVVAEL